MASDSPSVIEVLPWLYANPYKSNLEVSSIAANTLYKFVLTTSGGTVTYWNRLRSKPVTTDEVKSIKFPEFDSTTKSLMKTATLYSGGVPPSLSWATPVGTVMPNGASFSHPAGINDSSVGFATTSVSVSCTGNSDCQGGGPNYVSSMGGSLTGSSSYMFSLLGRNRSDLQLFTQLLR